MTKESLATERSSARETTSPRQLEQSAVRNGFNDQYQYSFPHCAAALGAVGDCLEHHYAEAGLAVPELCRELGISAATFYKWRAKFGGMDASLMARMKELEEENRRLRKMYIEEKLKAEVVAEALAKKW